MTKQLLLKQLKYHRSRLSQQQYKTLKGQVLSGDILGAQKGLMKLLNT